MNMPTVSFVVPCYKLAHFLPECVNSILSQSYADLEVLVMDDCSPDNTEEVARSFSDPRVKYVRNEVNLGALANYNKGISLSRGKYVWLISADDYLRSESVLKRYVDILESHPRVGYAFCPGVGVKDGRETGTLEFSQYGTEDRIVSGHTFLESILAICFVLAPSALVRKECYEKVSMFPTNVELHGTRIDFIWGGDWYLWCAFALYFDVAYFVEPMVCYREHGFSSTDLVTRQNMDNCVLADIAVPWMVKRRAEEEGIKEVFHTCLGAVADEYSRHLVGREYRSGTWAISLEQFERSLCQYTQSDRERVWIRARTFAAVADRYYFQGDHIQARKFYWASLKQDPLMSRVYAKLMLLSLGRSGETLRLRLKRMLQSL